MTDYKDTGLPKETHSGWTCSKSCILFQSSCWVRSWCESRQWIEWPHCNPIATSPPPVPKRPGKPMASKVTHNSVDLSCLNRLLREVLLSVLPSSSALKTPSAQEFITVSGLVAKAVYAFKVCTVCQAGHGPESELQSVLYQYQVVLINPMY